MAGVVTLVAGTEIDEIDGATGMHRIRRTFRYIRDVGDDEAILVTPTSGDAETLKKGIIEAPWAGIISIAASNIGITSNQPVAPFLNMSLQKGRDDVTVVGDGEIVDSLAGEDRAWPVSFGPGDDEQVRSFLIDSQAAGGRTYWMGFASENAKAADWLLTIQLREVA